MGCMERPGEHHDCHHDPDDLEDPGEDHYGVGQEGDDEEQEEGGQGPGGQGGRGGVGGFETLGGQIPIALLENAIIQLFCFVLDFKDNMIE